MPDEPSRQYEDAYLWTPADRVRLAELREAISSAVTNTQAKASGDAPRAMSEDPSESLREAAAAMDAFVVEAKSRARVVRMVALPRRKWRAMKDAHPARMIESKKTDAEGVEKVTTAPNETDEMHGFNVDSIADDLVEQCASGVDSDFIESLSEPDFDTLYAAALRVNVGGFAPPKAEFSSQVDRIIAAISSSQDPSD